MREKDKEIVNILKDVNMFERNMIVAIRSNIQGVFFSGPPPKISKHGKVNLGKVRCI